MNSELYSIDYNTELKVYVVVDRQGERVSADHYDMAADAIQFAETKYKGLV